MSDPDFEEQLRLEAVEKEKSRDGDGNTKVDPDGTVYEWDSEKKAWFPKIDADFIAQYQMNYGNFGGSKDQVASTPSDPSCKAPTSAPAPSTTATTPSTTAAATPAEIEAYWKYYNEYYKQAGHQAKEGHASVSSTSGDAPQTSDYDDYYRYYYQYYYHQHGDSTGSTEGETSKEPDSTSHKSKQAGPNTQTQDSEVKSDTEGKSCESTTGGDDATLEGRESTNVDSTSQEYYDYWSYYYNYYSTGGGHEAPATDNTETPHEQHTEENRGMQQEQGTSEVKGQTKEKEAKKRAPSKDEGWFHLQENHNTQVYVSGMPEDITDAEFKELMEKCGLIMHNPITRKAKLKLYKDENGVPKGDGLCCYIKMESVDLALQILDGCTIRGKKIHVEKAKFEMKGNYDPNKKRRKLTNKEKRKIKQQQQKLFDWRPDKPFGTRGKHERVVIVKNLFQPSEFEKDPSQINEIRDDLRTEGAKFGEIRKVVVYDAHPEGVASIHFKEPEEADACLAVLNGRWFAQRKITAETWDGITKYHVQETEEQKQARLRQWEDFLETEEEEKNSETGKRGAEVRQGKAEENVPEAGASS